jgi:hypothetical protein
VAAPNQGAVRTALERLVQWVRDVHGALGTADPPSWKPDRLEYDVKLAATTPDGRAVALAAYPGRFGEFDWYSFDQLGPGDRVPEREPAATTRSLVPINVRFRGMPNSRWWHFERGSMNLADVKADRSELAKLVLIDFMLVHGNDWFVVPFTQEVGRCAGSRRSSSTTCSATRRSCPPRTRRPVRRPSAGRSSA